MVDGALGGPEAADASDRPVTSRNGDRGKADRWRLRGRHFSVKLVLVLALTSVIVGFCCTQSTLQLVNVASAAYDARVQINAIEAIARSGNVTDTDHLNEVQTRLASLNDDLLRLQSALPGPIASTPTGSSLNHTLTMARDLVQAGSYGVDAALILVPHLKGALTDIGNSASATPATSGTTAAGATPTTAPPPGNVATGGLTMDEVTRAQQDILVAGVFAERALTERRDVNDGQLRAIGLSSVVSILQRLDGFAPKLPTYLGYADSVMSALPDLLGVTKPAHFLLFDLDSDEMRSTGGFMGNYALITMQSGRIIGGVHLNDTFRFDCPGGTNRCVQQGPPIPPQYAWMNAFPDSFRMRDANISPDFPTSAKLIMQKYQQEGGQAVDGVIMITPEIIKDILKLTGPLTVTGYDKVVDAQNLQDVIHYYHILNRNNFSTVDGNSAKKLFDSQLGGALLHKVASLSAAQQTALLKEILQGIGTKDVQVYLNDSRVESVLNSLHLDSTITMPTGTDGIMLSDTNVGATYYSRDLEETVKDTITFDTKGNALHDMTVTYTLPRVQHLYTSIYVDNNGSPYSWYSGVMRMIVPADAQAINGTYLPDGTLSAASIVQCNTPFMPSCGLLPAPEPGHVVWAVRINNMQVGGDSIIFHLNWMTPNVLKSVDGKTQYSLAIYRQAGTHISYDIKIVPPSGQQIALPLTDPLRTSDVATPGTSAEFTSPSLVKDILLKVAFVGS
jgi:hypothetical protein